MHVILLCHEEDSKERVAYLHVYVLCPDLVDQIVLISHIYTLKRTYACTIVYCRTWKDAIQTLKKSDVVKLVIKNKRDLLVSNKTFVTTFVLISNYMILFFARIKYKCLSYWFSRVFMSLCEAGKGLQRERKIDGWDRIIPIRGHMPNP